MMRVRSRIDVSFVSRSIAVGPPTSATFAPRLARGRPQVAHGLLRRERIRPRPTASRPTARRRRPSAQEAWRSADRPACTPACRPAPRRRPDPRRCRWRSPRRTRRQAPSRKHGHGIRDAILGHDDVCGTPDPAAKCCASTSCPSRACEAPSTRSLCGTPSALSCSTPTDAASSTTVGLDPYRPRGARPDGPGDPEAANGRRSGR